MAKPPFLLLLLRALVLFPWGATGTPLLFDPGSCVASAQQHIPRAGFNRQVDIQKSIWSENNVSRNLCTWVHKNVFSFSFSLIGDCNIVKPLKIRGFYHPKLSGLITFSVFMTRSQISGCQKKTLATGFYRWQLKVNLKMFVAFDTNEGGARREVEVLHGSWCTAKFRRLNGECEARSWKENCEAFTLITLPPWYRSEHTGIFREISFRQLWRCNRSPLWSLGRIGHIGAFLGTRREEREEEEEERRRQRSERSERALWP